MKNKLRDLRSYRNKQTRMKKAAEIAFGRGEVITCFYCKQPIDMTLAYTDKWAFTCDHPIALSDNGHVTNQELLPMHRSCNSRKGGGRQKKIQPLRTSRQW